MHNQFEKKIKVPFVDVSVKDAEKFSKIITQVIKNGDFILGEEVTKFEKEFASYLGVKYCVGVASGTDAILFALKALDISRGDEVIVPAFSFIASASPIIMLGAKPVFVDVRKDLPLIDENKIEEAITKKTRAIIVVHLYGYPCNMDKILAIAKKYKIALIEDVAQAHGSVYKGKNVGSFGDIAAFSFYPTKNLGAFGDAGAVVTNKSKLYKKFLFLRNHGQAKKYQHVSLGYNSRLDSVQAAVLRIKLKDLDSENNKKRKLVEKYNHQLALLPVILFDNKNLSLSPAYHLFVIRLKERNELSVYLKNRGIGSSIHYPRALVDENLFGRKLNRKNYQNARKYASSVLSLPLFPDMTGAQIEYVINSLTEYFFTREKKNKK